MNMNSTRKFSAVLLVSSGLALAVSLVAQGNSGGGSPSAGKSANAGNKGPVPYQPVTPNPAPHDPTVSTVPKPGSGMTPGAANSGSGVGGRESVGPVSTPATDATHPGNRPPVVGAASAPGFIALDTDRDGRISLTEFASPSASSLRAGAPGVNGDSATGKASPPLAAPGTRDVTGKPIPPGSGPKAGQNSTVTNAQLFQQIDTDRDGYVSAVELDAYRMPATSER